MVTMRPLIKIIKNQFMIVFAIVKSVIKSWIMNYLIKLQMIIAKTIAGLIKITTQEPTLITLTTQEQSNMMLAEMV